MATITTFCLAGASPKPRLDNDHLGGELFRPPYQRRDIVYSNKFVAQSNFDDGRAKLKAALLESRGQVVVLGQSLGARIAGSLMDDAEILAACPPDRCVYVLTGHPERKYGGAATVERSGIVSGYSYTGVPDDCQYRVWDVANEFERFADYPDDRSVKAAVDNVSADRHKDFSATFIGDPRNSVWVDPDNPNVTYVLAPSYPLPHIERSWAGLQTKARLDDEQRPEVNRGYNRPFPPPRTRVNRHRDSDWGWDADRRWYVRMPVNEPFRPFG